MDKTRLEPWTASLLCVAGLRAYWGWIGSISKMQLRHWYSLGRPFAPIFLGFSSEAPMPWEPFHPRQPGTAGCLLW